MGQADLTVLITNAALVISASILYVASINLANGILAEAASKEKLKGKKSGQLPDTIYKYRSPPMQKLRFALLRYIFSTSIIYWTSVVVSVLIIISYVVFVIWNKEVLLKGVEDGAGDAVQLNADKAARFLIPISISFYVGFSGFVISRTARFFSVLCRERCEEETR